MSANKFKVCGHMTVQRLWSSGTQVLTKTGDSGVPTSVWIKAIVGSKCSAVHGSGLGSNLTAKIFLSEMLSLFWVPQINGKKGEEGRKEAFSWIQALVLSFIRTQTFFHNSQVLDDLGLVGDHALSEKQTACQLQFKVDWV